MILGHRLRDDEAGRGTLESAGWNDEGGVASAGRTREASRAQARKTDQRRWQHNI